MRHYPALQVLWPGPPASLDVELLLAAVDEAGPVGVEDLPSGVRVFFRDDAARDAAASLASGIAPGITITSIDVPDEDWAARSQASITPVRVDRIVVSPPWAALDAAACAAAGIHQVVIRPAMGFGTGHHASTRLCLRLLQQVPVAGARVVDVGTGSGVLAIAAWRLGAAAVSAFDHDEDALASARENVDLNGAGEVIEVARRELDEGAPASDEPCCDIVLANLTGAVLERASAHLTRLACREGVLILGGVLAEETGRVAAALAGAGWQVAERIAEDEWVGLLLRAATSPSGSRAR